MKIKNPKIIFFGTSAFAVPVLRALKEEIRADVLAVVSTPPKPAGRKKEIAPSPVSMEARKLGLPVYEPEKLKSPGALFKPVQPQNPSERF